MTPSWKVLLLGTRNTPVSYKLPLSPDLTDVVEKLVGKTEVLQTVGYRQPYACIGVIGTKMRPLEATGNRGALVRLEARLQAALALGQN